MWNIEKTVKKGDYIYAVVRDHPRASKFGYVLEHRIVMENKLGRLLDKNEVVHHLNEDKKDNRPENLEVLSNSDHARKHQEPKGRMFSELKCPECDSIFHRPTNQTGGRAFLACSPRCRGKFSRKIQLYGRTHEVETAISANLVRKYKRFHDNAEETEGPRVP